MEDFQYFMALCVKLFATGSPPITVVLYLGMTQNFTPKERWEIAKKGLGIGLIILVLTLLCGEWILGVVGVQMHAFRMVAGLILGKLGFSMIYSNLSFEKGMGNDLKAMKNFVVVPLAFPTIVGVGTISATILSKADAVTFNQQLSVYGAAAFLMISFYVFFYAACFFSRWLKPALVNIFAKLTGLLLLTMAVQSFVCGVQGFWAK